MEPRPRRAACVRRTKPVRRQPLLILALLDILQQCIAHRPRRPWPTEGARREVDQESSELVGEPFYASLLASDAPIEAALEPVKLFQGIGERGCDVRSGSTVESLCLD
jgi:hypothetical protein